MSTLSKHLKYKKINDRLNPTPSTFYTVVRKKDGETKTLITALNKKQTLLSKLKFPPKKKKKKRCTYLQQRANKLNYNLPPSEKWFQSLFKVEQPRELIHSFQYNKPTGKYIPDCISYKFKIIIEIDGSIHDNEEQQIKDQIKQNYYEGNNYKVFRIRAFDINNYHKVLELVKNEHARISPS